ncbi:hypothetical protein NC651_039568 [Populus alba x Populus x berolinensis]|uniref:Uncharacterized protein n=1 Tax=Populus alba x Populus x berolinensis TaxID=444605 RepID=A0AAD6L815_9ROSI|nr:hypothetical protein NC651_039568 [Populus alba x Populus x berolinensis]KAJ6951493.1 hypothetical protein NC653_040814 [Populus alba x Populus x berolinensis]
MWLVKEIDVGKAGPTMELHEEQRKEHGILTVPLKSVDARSDAQQVSWCEEKVLAFI